MTVTDDARLLAERLHADPHRVLGLHTSDEGWVARAWRPSSGA